VRSVYYFGGHLLYYCKNSEEKMKKATIAKIALFMTAVLWGSTFTIGKLASEVFSAAFIIAVRFLIASVALLIVAYPQRKQLDKKYMLDGFWMGLTLFISYLLQVSGLTLDTSPGKSAFLCTTYSVMVPFIYWFVTKERPKIHHIVCVCLCLSGIGILSLSGGFGMSLGDIMTVASGVPYAVNIVISAIVCRNRNIILLTTIELWVVTILAWIFVFGGNSFPTEFPIDAVGGLVYLGVFATALCMYLQSFGLKYAEAAIGGMLLSLESVFGVIFSIIIYHEKITFRMVIGFVVIFMAILLSQWEGKKEENYA
jgi:drug/metabolite transporter (DMT)-like permease